MTPVTRFAGKRVAVFGLGGSGIVTARALLAGGALVAAWDDQETSRDAALAAGVPIVDLAQSDFKGFVALVLSPGVPLTHPKPHWTVEKAHAAGIEVIGDIELFCRQRLANAPLAPFVAITGTNGKSTTTALIAHLLKVAGRDVALGGNIGTAILDLAPPSPDRVHVIECSSYQIDLAPSLNPTIGVMLNLTPDHLDRHGDMAHYGAVKERLVAASDTAIIGVDDPWCRAMADRREAKGKTLVRVSVDHPLETGINRRGTELYWTCLGEERSMADLAVMATLRGVHNAQNAAAAIAAVSALGVSDDRIRQGLASFPGLAHRLEMVGHISRALIINDTKATNADATGKALASFPNGVFWIAGGRPKEGGIAPLAPFFERIEKAYLIGEAAEAFAATLEGQVPYVISGTLDKALAMATTDAQGSMAKEPVVLLSPACASFDQFKNFEMRGEHFRLLASAMSGFLPFAKG
jgi:UDP-N-acetylmuramoylalanine--D-glutamate ligase